MKIKTGKSYHIKDEFFELVNDEKLMSNKEDNNYRPHFFFVEDKDVDGLYWAIPQSTKVEKYKEIIAKKIMKYGKCNTIVIGIFGGKENAFLIQNMFPIVSKYIDHEHLISGKSIEIHKETMNNIATNAKEVLILYKKGNHKLIFPDVEKIYNIMIKELGLNEKQV